MNEWGNGCVLVLYEGAGGGQVQGCKGQIRKSSTYAGLKCKDDEHNATGTEPGCATRFLFSRYIISNRLLAETYIVLRKRVSGDSGAKGEGGKEVSGSAMTPAHTP